MVLPLSQRTASARDRHTLDPFYLRRSSLFQVRPFLVLSQVTYYTLGSTWCLREALRALKVLSTSWRAYCTFRISYFASYSLLAATRHRHPLRTLLLYGRLLPCSCLWLCRSCCLRPGSTHLCLCPLSRQSTKLARALRAGLLGSAFFFIGTSLIICLSRITVSLCNIVVASALIWPYLITRSVLRK